MSYCSIFDFPNGSMFHKLLSDIEKFCFKMLEVSITEDNGNFTCSHAQITQQYIRQSLSTGIQFRLLRFKHKVSKYSKTWSFYSILFGFFSGKLFMWVLGNSRIKNINLLGLLQPLPQFLMDNDCMSSTISLIKMSK